MAGTLLGFVGRDGDGLEGLERHWEESASTPSPVSTSSCATSNADACGSATRAMCRLRTAKTSGCRSTRSSSVSRRKNSPQAVEHFNADSGQIIVMQPHTGEVLALATYPSYNPNAFGEVEDAQRRNRPVTDVFEPGSIFKPFVWAGLTGDGRRPPRRPDRYAPTAGRMAHAKRPNTARRQRANPDLSWHEVLKYSSNIGMAKGRLARRCARHLQHHAVVRLRA